MSNYLKSFEHYTKGLTCLNVGGGVKGCGECEDQCEDSTEFSWSQCDGCGSTLGGSRHSAHGLSEKYGWLHLEVCVDCLMFIAYGDLPEE